MALEPHYPSSPTRPPKAHFYFTGLKPDGTEHFFFTHAYGAMYAAAHWLQRIMDEAEGKLSWLSTNVIRIYHEDTGYSIIIKGELEDAIEYQPTKEEASWTITHPDTTLLRRAIMFWSHSPTSTTDDKSTSSTENAPSAGKTSKPTSAPKRHKTTKAPPTSDQITVAQIADSLNIQPNKARNILRKANIQKPTQGWTFNTSDPMVQTITKLLQAG